MQKGMKGKGNAISPAQGASEEKRGYKETPVCLGVCSASTGTLKRPVPLWWPCKGIRDVGDQGSRPEPAQQIPRSEGGVLSEGVGGGEQQAGPSQRFLEASGLS